MRHGMRLAASVSFAFLLGSISISAQNAGVGVAGLEEVSKPSTPVSTSKMGSGCPVSLRAQHGSDGTMRKVDKSRPEGIAQKLHLILTSKNSRQVVEAQLRVRGASGKGNLSRTDSAQDGMDATRNVIVNLNPSAENQFTGDAWVPGMSAVLQVEVNGVIFADGSMQRFSAAEGCRFTPEHLMLIAKDSD